MIRPTALQDGHAWLRHDREEVNGAVVGGHDGVAAIADLRHPNGEDGKPQPHLLDLPCPEPSCRWSSIQPVGGGGLSEADTAVLQRIFAERLLGDGWRFNDALARISWLIASTDGDERNLLRRPATAENREEYSMQNEDTAAGHAGQAEVVELDLGAAIVEEIDRTLGVQFKSSISPMTAELLDYIFANRQALQHRTAALKRIKASLEAAADMRDNDVTGA